MHANLCTCYFTRFFIYFSYRRLCITLDAKILCQTLSKHGDRFEEGSLFRQKIIQCIFMHKIKCWSYTIINNNYYYIYIDYLLVLTIINLIFLSICMRTYLSWNKLKRYPVIEKVYRELGPIHLLFWRQISFKTSTEPNWQKHCLQGLRTGSHWRWVQTILMTCSTNLFNLPTN